MVGHRIGWSGLSALGAKAYATAGYCPRLKDADNMGLLFGNKEVVQQNKCGGIQIGKCNIVDIQSGAIVIARAKVTQIERRLDQ